MSDNIHYLNNITKLDSNPDHILKPAIGELSSVIIVGYDKDGYEYFASSLADAAQVVWLLERAKIILMELVDNMNTDLE